MAYQTLHPGKYLFGAYVMGEGIKPPALAKRVHLSLEELNALFNQEIVVDRPLAEKLAKGLGTSVELWLNLQRNYEKGVAHRRSLLFRLRFFLQSCIPHARHRSQSHSSSTETAHA